MTTNLVFPSYFIVPDDKEKKEMFHMTNIPYLKHLKKEKKPVSATPLSRNFLTVILIDALKIQPKTLFNTVDNKLGLNFK